MQNNVSMSTGNSFISSDFLDGFPARSAYSRVS